ncbi:MAG TPA: hypothetical protein VKY74_13925 [Chloroflexia bacterium]|nr:hypothetical protein [Chloroflexia bacterium]
MVEDTLPDSQGAATTARAHQLGVWLVGELGPALRGRLQTQQQLRQAVEHALLPDGPLADPAGQAFAAEILHLLALEQPPTMPPVAPTPADGPRRRRAVV